MNDDRPIPHNTISYEDWIDGRLRTGWRERFIYLSACLMISIEDRNIEAIRYGLNAVRNSMKGRKS